MVVTGSEAKGPESDMRVGVLALQGDFAEHLGILEQCGYEGVPIRTSLDLDAVSALIIPGGESTTILKLIDRVDLREPLTKRISAGMPVFGTCAGAIVLSDSVGDGEPPLGVLPAEIRRNAYGRQAESFETDISVPALSASIRGVFIRAPVIVSVGPGVDVLAESHDHPVLVRSGNLLAATFHPELAGEQALHRFFVEEICKVAG